MNIEKSLSDKFWEEKQIDFKYIQALSQKKSISEIFSKLLISRGVFEDNYDNYINPNLLNNLPDPFELKDMKKGIERCIEALKNNEKIGRIADYDVDGGASAALLYKWFENFKIKPTIYIPDRDKEGYGPNIEAMSKLSLAHDLIICVDCGTMSDNPITKAKNNNCHVIVIDHHQGGDKNTKADALVNPNRLDEKSELKFLCAAGVTFLLVVALNRELKKLLNQFLI